MITQKLHNVTGLELKCGVPSHILITGNSTDPGITMSCEDSVKRRIKMGIINDSCYSKIKISDRLKGRGGSPSCKINLNLSKTEIDLAVDAVRSTIGLNDLWIRNLELKNVQGALGVSDSHIKKMRLKLTSVKSQISLDEELLTARIEATKGSTRLDAAHFFGNLECRAVGTKLKINDMFFSGNCNFKQTQGEISRIVSCKAVGGDMSITDYHAVEAQQK